MKRAAAVLGIAITGSQAGHLLAYELRFGAAARELQSSGAHAYFPVLAKTFLGAAALALMASLFVIGFARLAAGQKINRQAAPSLLRLLAALYTLQLALFIFQEAVEGSPAGELFLWGLLGQLPVALVGAVALRWLLTRIEPAIARLTARFEPALRVAPNAVALVLWPASPDLARGIEPVRAINPRGPPPSF